MKTNVIFIVLLFLTVFFSCKKKENDIENINTSNSNYSSMNSEFTATDDIVMTDDTTSFLRVLLYKQAFDYKGDSVAFPVNGVISIWENPEDDFEIKSYEDAINGVAYSPSNDKMISTKDIISGEGVTGFDRPPGKYLISVALADTEYQGGDLYSYHISELEKSGRITLRKVFLGQGIEKGLEQWNEVK